MAPTRHRAPLTRETLHAIGERNRGNADIQALLWEIHRLRAIALRADQLLRSMPGSEVGTLGMLVGALRRELDGEPAVLEQQAQTEALLGRFPGRGGEHDSKQPDEESAATLYFATSLPSAGV
jgi:hypothetical protein